MTFGSFLDYDEKSYRFYNKSIIEEKTDSKETVYKGILSISCQYSPNCMTCVTSHWRHAGNDVNCGKSNDKIERERGVLSLLLEHLQLVFQRFKCLQFNIFSTFPIIKTSKLIWTTSLDLWFLWAINYEP